MGLSLTVWWPAAPEELGVQVSLAQQLVQLLEARPVQHRILAAEHVLQICCGIVTLCMPTYIFLIKNPAARVHAAYEVRHVSTKQGSTHRMVQTSVAKAF